MKRIVLVIFAFCLLQISYSQTNTFPASGGVGIGTTSPSTKLEVLSGASNNEIARFGGTVSARGLRLSSFVVNGANEVGFNFDAPGASGGAAISFSTLSAERMRINYNGNIGIGTTSPVANLQIGSSTTNGLLNLGGYSFVGSIRSSGALFMGFNAYAKYSSGTEDGVIRAYQSSLGGVSLVHFKQDGDINFYQKVSNVATDEQLNVASNSTVVFKGNGKVGIGTTTPSEKLAVNGGVSIEGNNSISSFNGFNNSLQLKNGSNAAIVFNPGQSTELMFGFHSDGNFYWGAGPNAGNSYCMFLSKTGNLGITGKLTTSEVNVKIGGWADFVFHPSYKLRPLGEVEQFIKTNNHLPEIPTESEVKQNGIGLGEMNAKLLQKIEELTLYMIEQQKQINELREQNNMLVIEVQNIKK